jgi:transposase InsO family protein
VKAVCEGLNVSERRACKALGQYRSTQRHIAVVKSDENALTAAIVGLAAQYGRYGYKRVTGLLREAGWRVNKKRVERIWRREGLKVPSRQPKRGRLWFNDGSCVRLRPKHPNHDWAYDFVAERTYEGKAYRMLTVIDEYSWECLAIVVARRINSHDVLYTLADLFIRRGIPAHIRSDNGPEFCAKAVREWLSRLGVGTLFIEPVPKQSRSRCLDLLVLAVPWRIREWSYTKFRVDRSVGADHGHSTVLLPPMVIESNDHRGGSSRSWNHKNLV